MIASTQTNHPMAITHDGEKAQSAVEQACIRMRESGLRITQPRISIISSLFNRGKPANIEQIHGDLPPDTCDLVTVYRCLSVFQKIGLVRLTHFHNGASAYQLTLSGSIQAPYHIISKRGNEVCELDEESVAELRAVMTKIEDKLRASGYEEVSHIAEFFFEKKPVVPIVPPVVAEIPDPLQARGIAAPIAV